MDRPVDNLLALGLTLRLTRLITTDWLGHWWFVQPARRWALYGTRLYHAPAEVIDQEWTLVEPTGARQKLVKGLDCPHCVGFWIGGLVLLGSVVCTALGPTPRALWRFTAAAFSLSYLAGHISARLDS